MEQGFHIFVKMYCLKFPSKCINLVQYMEIFNNQATIKIIIGFNVLS